MSISKLRVHDCHEHYELKTYKKLFSCDGCKMKGFGERYHCNPCGSELHKVCRFPKELITHEFFGCSNFAFLEKPFTRIGAKNSREYSKICDACGKEISGYSYHCEKDNLDVHPHCLKLEKYLKINEDMGFNLKANVVSKCIWCKRRRISDDNRVLGWSYLSTCGKYHFHVYCMTEMVHDACARSGETSIEKVDIKKLVKTRRNKGSRSSTVFQTIKSILKIVLSALLGDPTLLISSVFVELISRGLQ